MEKSLHRSRANKMLGGVCGGLGRYLGIDATLIRVFFVIVGLANGAGVWIYFVLWLAIPLEGIEGDWQHNVRVGVGEIRDKAQSLANEVSRAVGGSSAQTTWIVGAGLVLIGVVFLLQSFNVPWLRWLRFGTLWPLVLVAVGIIMLVRRSRED